MQGLISSTFYSNTTSLSAVTTGGTNYIPQNAASTTTNGSGTGMTIKITTNAGVITSGVIVEPGLNYANNDIVTITGNPAGAGGTFTIGTGGVTGSQIAPTFTPIPHGPS